MGVDELMQLIGTLGFPIVACGALFWQNIKQGQRHSDESKAFNEAITNNTMAITKMTSLLEGIRDDKGN